MFSCHNGTKRALLMANTYSDSKHGKLSCTVNDIDQMKDILTKKLGFEPIHIEIHIDIIPLNIINQFLKNIKPNDLLFIFFADHGHIPSTSIKIPMDAGLSSSWVNPDGTLCFSYYIDELLSKINAKCKIILCSDTCYSGYFLSNYTGKNPIYFIGATDSITPSTNYSLNNDKKMGGLVIIFDYVSSKTNDIDFNQLAPLMTEYRKKDSSFMRALTLKSYNINE